MPITSSSRWRSICSARTGWRITSRRRTTAASSACCFNKLKPEEFFSPDYGTARARFRDAATAAGAALHAMALAARGPNGEALCIDIAWLGAARPRRVFLHTSGLHGVEAFTGSAVQLALLAAPPAPRADDALVLVHVLNPYGMAWLRRANENNVDLNRNFLVSGPWSGAPRLYRVLDPLLNPRSPPARDGFAVRAAALAVRHGFNRVKQAVAEGQYEYPRGLFFGGHALERGPRLYSEWLQRHLSQIDYLFALDLHTGLGRRGTDTIFSEAGATNPDTLGKALGRRLASSASIDVAYTVRGGLGAALPVLLPRARTDFMLQEIGTYPPLAVLHALREENRWHFYGDASVTHPVKLRLCEMLCPAAVEWRRRAATKGTELAQAAARYTFSHGL